MTLHLHDLILSGGEEKVIHKRARICTLASLWVTFIDDESKIARKKFKAKLLPRLKFLCFVCAPFIANAFSPSLSAFADILAP
jgi:hypothetical protein